DCCCANTSAPDAYTASDRPAIIGNSDSDASRIIVRQAEEPQWPCTDCPCPRHAGARVKKDDPTHHFDAVRRYCSRSIETAFPVEFAFEFTQRRSSILF